MMRFSICVSLNLIGKYKFNKYKVDMVLDEAGIDGDGKFRYNDFVDRLNSDN